MAGSRRKHDVVASLQQRLFNSFVETESRNRFIPNGTLEEIMDEQSLYQVLLTLERSSNPNRDCDDVQTIYQQVRSSSLKVFAILILLGSHDVISSFLKIGIDDNNLPYQSATSNALAEGDSSGDRDKWVALKDLWSEAQLYLFFNMQWSVLAPCFVRNVDVPNLTRHHILPFLPVEDESSPGTQRAKTGSFGEVRKVRIHPKHHDFGDTVTSNSSDLFAVKRLYTHEKRFFESELSTLRHLQKFQHPHLIQLLTSFRIREHDGCDAETDSFYLIFPWADGNLRDFWVANEKLVGDKRVIPWISAQCCGLAAALALIHEGGHHTTTPEKDRKFGTHGDIKAQNILWFKAQGKDEAQPGGLLVLADFGLSIPLHGMSHPDVSASNIRVSATYRPPEVEVSRKISRKMDIWMLGCTYLELVTWFLLGPKAVTTDFCNFRSERDRYGIKSDTFFRIDVNDGLLSAQLKPRVIEWITRLSSMPQCSQYLQQFLILIKTQMLSETPYIRITASKLQAELEYMDREFIESDEKPSGNLSQANMKAFIRALRWPMRKFARKPRF
ncbi:kinase-like domain-containing protein [Xylaria sp. FL1042]|nr:kinase-like domain-containing protein [Xylaria sp. FL1042]